MSPRPKSGATLGSGHQLMSDDGFHEIQLNGKQLVFLFMAATVVSVVIFLCGVMVGRGVVRAQQSSQLASATDEAASDPTLVARTAPPAASASGDAPLSTQETLTYPQRLEEPEPPAETLRELTPCLHPHRPRGRSRPLAHRDGSGCGRAGGQRIRRPGCCRAPARRGRHHRASSQYQGLSRICDVTSRGSASLPRARRKVQRSARSGVDRRAGSQRKNSSSPGSRDSARHPRGPR